MFFVSEIAYELQLAYGLLSCWKCGACRLRLAVRLS